MGKKDYVISETAVFSSRVSFQVCQTAKWQKVRRARSKRRPSRKRPRP